MPFKRPGKIIFKGKIDPRLIPTDSAPGFEIVDAKITESAVEVWLSDGRIIITPLSWYPTLKAATPKQRRGFEILGVGLAWEERCSRGRGNSVDRLTLSHSDRRGRRSQYSLNSVER
ncbi:MAG TPA: DUF2442 domain-containing protein [Chthoniobacterales bacterium]|jgi:hypothetical protein|nr:DUF2442 domain-containing protein [Chthoniobacterales bacterium]